MDFLIAALPLLLLLVLMLGWRWHSAHAGIISWLTAILIAVLKFGAGAPLLLGAHIRALFLALNVLYIIWGALFFYRVTEAAGAVAAMSELLTRISPHRPFHVLLLAWGFTAFLQSVGGYGVPVAIVAPLLVGMGFPPLPAFVMASLGHAWSISFGSAGASFEALYQTTHVPRFELACWSAALLGVLCLLMGAAALWVAGGKIALRQGIIPMFLMGSVMASVQWLAACQGLFATAAMLSTLAGLVTGVVWALWQKRPIAFHPMKRLLFVAISPYALLLLFILAATYFQPLHAVLNHPVIRFPATNVSLERNSTGSSFWELPLFGHTGALLLYATLLTWWRGRHSGAISPMQGPRILRQVLHSGLASTLGILAMVALATVMDDAGMITVLAQAIAQAAGHFFPLVAPFIGALGAFVTGSNTNANVLFGSLQRDIAQALGYAPPLILAAQNAGGAIGSTFAPAKVVVGCSTVGLEAQEGTAMRALLRYALLTLGLLSGLTYALSWL